MSDQKIEVSSSYTLSKTVSLYLLLTLAFFAASMQPVLLAGTGESGTWESLGPGSASVLGVVSDPLDLDKLTMMIDNPYDCSVYRTYDGAQTWTKISEISVPLKDMIPHSFHKLYAFNSNSWFASIDSGNTWGTRTIPPSIGYMQCACIHPDNPDLIYGTGSKYVHDPMQPMYYATFFKSEDGGNTWEYTYFDALILYSYNFYRIAMSRSNPDIAYTVGSGRLYRTENGGTSVTEITDSIPSGHGSFYAVAVDPVDPDRVYVAGTSFYYSEDGGATWTQEPSVYGVRDISIDPVDHSKIVVAGISNVYVSNDYGHSFSVTHNVLSGNQARVHMSSADPSKVYVTKLTDQGVEGGLYRSVDGGTTWQSALGDLRSSSIGCMDISRSQPGTVFAHKRDVKELLATYDNGLTWEAKTYPSDWDENLPAIHIHSENPDIIIAIVNTDTIGDNDQIYRSIDGGDTWMLVDNWFHFGELIIENPDNPDHLYAVGRYYDPYSRGYDIGICKSYDAGQNWFNKIIVDNPNYSESCRDMAISETNPSILYMVGEEGSYTEKVWRSSDGAETWSDVTNNLVDWVGSGESIWSVWISPHDPDRVLIGSTDGIYQTDDGGDTWEFSSLMGSTKWGFDYFPAIGELFVLSPPSTIYRSLDQGETWELFAENLNVSSLKHIRVDNTNARLYFGSWSGGILGYQYRDLPHMTTGAEEIVEATGKSIELGLFAGEDNADRNYLIVGGVTGTSPGTALPGGVATLPINWDIFSDLEMSLLNSYFFNNFMGTLNELGNTTAQLNVPALPPGTAPLTLYFAYCCNNPFDFASNAVSIDVVN